MMAKIDNSSNDHGGRTRAIPTRRPAHELLAVVLFWALHSLAAGTAAADEQNLNIQHDMQVLSPSEPLHELVPKESPKRKAAKVRAKRKRAKQLAPR